MVLAITPLADDKRDPRLRVLDPFVEQIRLWATRPGAAANIRFGEWSYSLDPPVARSMMRFCSSEGGDEDRKDKVVTQGVALLAKCMTDLCPADEKDPASLNDFYATQAELMLDVAVGTALIKETQLSLNELVAGGLNDEARGLGGFHHDLRNMVLDVRRTIGEYEKARAAILADVFLPEDPATEEGSEAEPEEPEEEDACRLPRQHTRLARRLGKRKKKTEPKIILSERPKAISASAQFASTFLVIVLALTGGVFMASRQATTDVVRTATAASLAGELDDIPEIERIQDRPPYVVLTARQEFWSAAAEPARLEWVRTVTKRAANSGYKGLVVRSAAGRPLAEWVKGKKVRLVPAADTTDRPTAGA